MSNLLQKIAELPPEKRQLLLQKLNQQKGKTAPAKIEPQSRDTQTFPLSFAQQRLWFFSQLEPESSAYNIPAAIQLAGRLNVLALENSINQIVHRHHILRTNFQVINSEPVQVIRAETNLQIPIIVLENISENIREIEAIRLAKLEAEKPFDLEKDLLLRVSLLRLSETNHVILFTMHHIISDGWSTGILIRELTSFYKAFDSNQKCNLPELPIQYVDFAVWQRQYLQRDILQTQLNYWKQQLSGNLLILELPTDRPRPAIQTDRGTSQSFTLSLSLTAALKHLSQQEEVTLFMILLAAFKVLLYRYTQQEDILVGTPIANRNRSEIEGLIGFFVNTLVLRSNLEGNPTFHQLLTQVKKTTLAAYNHQDLPFEQLVEELQPERNLSHSSLFQVMFILQNAPTEVLHLPDLTIKPLQVERKTANFDLTLSMVETDIGLRGSLEYNTDLFDDDRITRMLAHFQTLLAGIVLYPQQNISELPLLTTSEQQQIFMAGNTDQISIPQQCIHQLFEAQVIKNSDAVAAVFEEKQLTYQELNQRANQLANYLQKQGVKPEVLVGICLERSLELVVAVLGILKAGGAYLPIDPAYPQERLTYMLTDAQVSIILTQKQLLAVLPDENRQTICIDSEWQKITKESLENPLNQVNINHLAYVIYTSGSTGKSKGVMIEHRNLINTYFAWEEAYKLTAITAHLQMASFSFDVFSGDLVRALCSGAKLVISPRELLLEPEKLYQLMLREKVDCAEFVPGVLRNLIQYLEQTQKRLDFLKLLICGSDSWYIQEYDKFRQYCGDKIRLINSFGLTEATIDSTYFETDTTNLSQLSKDQLVPIGKPFANTQIYILDQYLQLLPVGIPGEIYIGGAGLARGYLHKPELTASKFIPNGFCEETGSFLYKTGDLGRWLQDGNIELIGRTDNQVKLRGFRIELGEIEAILSKHSMVKESVVIVREDHPKQQKLVAYIVPELGDFNHINSTTFQEFLKQQLPNYMIPSAFVILKSFPLTPNGKIDRRALPKPEYQELQTAFIAPQTQTELTLAQIWSEILKVEKVGINDNFFELGGNSLLTTKLMLKIRSTLQIDFPLRLLFESATIANLAVYLDKIIKSESIDPLIPENLIDWDQETILDPQIYPVNTYQKSAKQPQAIFLTGATGFLGAFLLWELLQQTQANIYCLVRARDIVAGKKKIQEILDSYLIGNESFYQRIIPVIGDLSQPYLGLNKSEFQDLANQLDVIYHNGAWVNHIYPYSVLKSANVLGTQEILRLACLGKTKPVHFVSTTSIFSQSSISGVQVITEADNSDTHPVNTNGYVQTKWVSEKLLATARNRGIPINIYRIGRVSGHSQTGVFNINDLLYKLIIGCIQLGTVPNRDIQEDIMPVDYVSKAIVYLSTQEKSLDKAFHLFNNQVVHTDNLLRVIHSSGYQVKQVPYQDWRSQLINTVGDLPEHPLYPLVPFFSAKTSYGKSEQSGTLQFDSQNVITGLADSSIICPDIDDKLLATYISYLANQGFIN
ncbi:non-ribosomal peptide synthetase [Dolichospermum sp. UHCC 0259]|uniref:non-ribosomal peptide synthetase family protein n=1 Tax=Dolichospermum sp. UHCC 0259 TaxID=2590010 RepID=UPI0014471127|nr:non-ribosomal peptide synthetase [Dolichospermum sp. UHCC 0259]MTJ48116.1 amino acid adenylation domain-containing protein [Dolichospermum sp. UHCC 0259]